MTKVVLDLDRFRKAIDSYPLEGFSWPTDPQDVDLLTARISAAAVAAAIREVCIWAGYSPDALSGLCKDCPSDVLESFRKEAEDARLTQDIRSL